MRAVLRTPLRLPIATTAVVALALATLYVGSLAHRTAVVTDQVSAAAAEGQVNVAVEMGFVPEAFNISYLQDHANAVSVQGTNAMLFGTTAASIDEIAGKFWVTSITLVGSGS